MPGAYSVANELLVRPLSDAQLPRVGNKKSVCQVYLAKANFGEKQKAMQKRTRKQEINENNYKASVERVAFTILSLFNLVHCEERT